jgi:SAM-dependent methyltransferase
MLTVDLDRLRLGSGDSLLDMGCGGGRHAFAALRRGARVVAFDADGGELKAVRDMVEAMAVEGEIPDLPLHVFEKWWERLCSRFGLGEPTSSAARKRGLVLAGVSDRIVGQLEDKGLVHGWGRDGQAHIVCPFKDEHTSESALSATSYFPAGTGGYAQGHFKCLHAHCAHRTDTELKEIS